MTGDSPEKKTIPFDSIECQIWFDLVQPISSVVQPLWVSRMSTTVTFLWVNVGHPHFWGVKKLWSTLWLVNEVHLLTTSTPLSPLTRGLFSPQNAPKLFGSPLTELIDHKIWYELLWVYLLLVHFVHSLIQKTEEKKMIFEITHKPVKLV